jgi:plasmid stabilization system protein ParE
MRQFGIKFSDRAKSDLQESYDWGVVAWGREAAAKWITQIEELIDKRLSNIPLACPVAAESAEFDFEIRHLVIRRYRILFRIHANYVLILRITGPFSGHSLELD